jgi:flagellar biosynthesis/type III secretory pathway M-ring protein FliF/YscJ
MVSKDQAIGGVIFIVCAIVGLFYVVTLFYPQWLGYFNLTDTGSIQFWIVAIPVLVAFIAIMGIGAWIGWTMATTPPPKPIEEITSEMEKEEKPTVEEKPEAKTEEKPAPETPKEEAKKPERKKKGEE